ncbi:hypothetical protein ACT7CZ_11115 [Bacillus cereus]
MPYHKDKQQAFQAAQQGVTQAEHAFNNIVNEVGAEKRESVSR